MLTLLYAAALGSSLPAMVTVPGTSDRPGPGRCGHVSYDFSIDRTEVSNDAYVEFLNAVAAADPAGLFHPLMQAHFWGGIVRTGSPGSFRYASKPGYADLPVTFVSWAAAARYANWQTFGKPHGPQRLGATEGDKSSGSYDTSSAWPKRNPNAVFALPTCDEWSKAAYFDQSSRTYASFPTGGSLRAGSAAINAPQSANLASGAGWANPYPHLAAVTAYSASAAKSGTLNQAGNVMEWAENRVANSRAMLGGSLFMNVASAGADYKDSELPDHHLSTLGFRLVRLPGKPLQQRDGPVYSSSAAKAAKATTKWVRVGVPGNEPDPIHGKGRVTYAYDIQRTEISNAEYATFLNATAREADPFGLFALDMQTGVGGGLERRGEAGGYSYAAKPGWETRAAAYLSWFSLARMANWEHFGRPSVGKEVLGSTEGTDRQGAYDTRRFPKAGEKYDPAELPDGRNSGARYFIPNDDEWFKAAYFDPGLTAPRRYWDYPTRSNSPPALSGPGSANYQLDDAMGEGAPFYVANVDSYSDSPSPWGTLQQGGNLWEWLEGWRSRGKGDCWRCNEWTRGLRGGSYNYTYRGLRADNVDPGTPEQAYFVYGGRLARAVSTDGWTPPAQPSLIDRANGFARGNPKRLIALAGVVAVIGSLIVGFWLGRASPRRSEPRRRRRSAVGN